MKTESIIEYVNAIDDYNNITELNINRFNILGEILCVDLNDLEYFPRLSKLSLFSLSLDDKDLQKIASLNNLEVLELYNCDISIDGFFYLFNDMKCSNLLLDNSYVDFSKINIRYNKIILRNIVGINNFKCDVLDISKTDFDIMNLPNDLKTLIISKTQYDMYEEFFKSKKIHLVVKSDEYDEVVAEYE